MYFPIPVEIKAENAATLVEEGDLAYWPEGRCFCIFFGLTPASKGSEIRPASPVNLLGRLKGDPKLWKIVEPGSTIKLEKA
ncbi:MAG: cyclophilin-like family protein [Bacillota bacterium]|nr:cyclophilin-like family protein [Bacillota bacterium]